jgi:shikimate dehydrogenase
MQLFGLIGYPLGHSFSKQYFTEKFLKEGLTDCSFEAFAIASIDEFPSLLKNNPALRGLSVTIPYKEQVLQFVDEISEEVKFIGATNSIKIADNKLTAYNTDIIGFRQSFTPFLLPHHTKALVLGTGGSSKAVQYVLTKMGIDFLIVSRNKSANQKVITYTQINEVLLREYPVIINCSPVGMYPNENDCPEIPYQFLSSNNYLFDLVYKPAPTLFLQKGAEKNALIKNGHDMLLIQAEASWKIWNNL